MYKKFVCSLFKEAARKGDLEGKLFYSSHVLRNALGTNKDEDFIEAANMLHEVIAEDPEKEAAYFYLGYLYEFGKFYIFILKYNKTNRFWSGKRL